MAAEKFRVTVRPSGANPNLLTVQDAMQQVLDIFDLLQTDTSENNVVWRLSFASTNSPFTAEGEAVSAAPGIDITVMARAEKTEFVTSFNDLLHGRAPVMWMGTPKAKIAARLFARNQNGIGETDILFDSAQPPLILRADIAQRVVSVLGVITDDLSLPALYRGDHAREERGSVEGQILQVGTYYGEPAIKFKERKSGIELWCRISANIAERISKQADFADVWNHRRVTVRGKIAYRADGLIARIFADNIERIEPKKVSTSELHDPTFTGGMSVSEYLEKFREGDLGR